MIVTAMYGWKRSAKEGYVVTVTVNGKALASSHGRLASNPADRSKMMWWVWSGDLSHGDIITLETKVGVRFSGRDSDRTTNQTFRVNSDYPVMEITVPKVGFKKFPLLKGPLETIVAETEQEAQDDLVASLFDATEGD